MTRLLCALLLLPSLCLAAPDLASNEGMKHTCTTLPAQAKALKSNAERQAFVVCHDIALLQQVIAWATKSMAQYRQNTPPDTMLNALRDELGYVRDQLDITRNILGRLKLKPNEGLKVTPAAWQVDLNSDGKLETWEQLFFAIPKRGEHAFNARLPSNDPAYYQQYYQLEAGFVVDQSDVLWALAYHQFAEGLMELLLAHQVNFQDAKNGLVELHDPAALQRAHQLMGAGLATSAALRRALLAETDDQQEWIPNPRQKDSVFPMTLDPQTFDTWGQVLAELQPLWAGKTLLVVDAKAGGMLGQAAKLCPSGQGLNVAFLFQHPSRYPLSSDGMRTACQTVDQPLPASGLAKLINQAAERGRSNTQSPEWQFVRYLYWVN
ncbi:MAG: hypothetical protein PHI11_14695 [Gallionella sp.]|nr:hypothetical protein [Gallionella sp.]